MKVGGWLIVLVAVASFVGLILADGRRRLRLQNWLLCICTTFGKVGALRWLLRWGADPNASYCFTGVAQHVDDAGHVLGSNPPKQFRLPVLMGAISAQREAVVRVLVEYGADLNAPDNHGMTALMSCTFADQANLARYLICMGADVHARDAEGRTALGWARHYDAVEVCNMLEEAGGTL